MGSSSAKIDKIKMVTILRQAKARMTIRRGQKVNAVVKKKKDIKAHLESGNEGMAMIHVII